MKIKRINYLKKAKKKNKKKENKKYIRLHRIIRLTYTIPEVNDEMIKLII